MNVGNSLKYIQSQLTNCIHTVHLDQKEELTFLTQMVPGKIGEEWTRLMFNVQLAQKEGLLTAVQKGWGQRSGDNRSPGFLRRTSTVPLLWWEREYRGGNWLEPPANGEIDIFQRMFGLHKPCLSNWRAS